MLLKELRKLAIFGAAVAVISFGSLSAHAAPVYTSAGSCNGSDNSGGGGSDCVTAVGHIAATVTSLLSVNEQKAMNFGDMAIPCGGASCAGDSFVVLDPQTSSRTKTVNTDAIYLLSGVTAGAAGNNGGQSAGIFKVSNGDASTTAEGNSTQVYVSFADASGNPIDYSGDSFYPSTNVVTLTGPSSKTFTVDSFTVYCNGATAGTATEDVYGHYCDNSTMPFTFNVGAKLHTVASTTYAVGKYVGTYNVTVSY